MYQIFSILIHPLGFEFFDLYLIVSNIGIFET